MSKAIYDDTMKATAALHEITVLREQMQSKSAARIQGPNTTGSARGAAAAAQGTPKAPVTTGESLETDLDKIAGRPGGGGGRRGAAGPPTLMSVRVQLVRIEHSIQNADVRPTAAQVEAYAIAVKPLPDLLAAWDKVKKTDLKALNAERAKAHLAALELNTDRIDHDVEDQIEIGDVE